jgi:hypothetical protein
METLAEIQQELEKALRDSSSAQSAYDSALAKLEPLKTTAEEKRAAVQTLIGRFQAATGTETPRRSRRGGVSGPRKSYNIDPKKKIEAAGKRAITRAVTKNPHLSDAEKKKIGRDAEKSLAAKLGV